MCNHSVVGRLVYRLRVIGSWFVDLRREIYLFGGICKKGQDDAVNPWSLKLLVSHRNERLGAARNGTKLQCLGKPAGMSGRWPKSGMGVKEVVARFG